MKTKNEIIRQDQFHSILHILKYSITLLVITGAMMLVFFLMMGRLKVVVYQLKTIETHLKEIELKLNNLSTKHTIESEHNSGEIKAVNFICDSKNYGCINATPLNFKYDVESNTSSRSCKGRNGDILLCGI